METEGNKYSIDNHKAAGLRSQMEEEIQQFLTEKVTISENNDFSQYKLVRRIKLFESHVYPTGKFDSQGNYKFWFDIITPRIDNEVKNIDFDSRDVNAHSTRKNDELLNVITNLALVQYQKTTGQAEEMNSAIEEGSGWGNILWKKVQGSYERCDLSNVFVINQTARTVDETPIIERHPFSQSDLRERMGKWAHIQEVIDNCGSETYKTNVSALEQKTTVPYYEIFERNGEVKLSHLKEAHGHEVLPGDENKYVFAKVLAAGKRTELTGVSIQYILWAGEMKGKKNSDIYEEFHRGRYKGRWWREGLYELLFDVQVRANQIGNQIAQGLEFAAKKVFYSPDKLIVQNILTDIKNGEIIKATNLAALDVRMEGLDQLIADWNRLVQLANDISNSREVVVGDSGPAGMPFRLGAMLNQNANKLFDLLREKFSIPLSKIYEKWVIPELVKDIRMKDVLRLTGDSDMLRRLQELIVEDWYVQNLLAIGPHSPEEAVMLKTQKLMELQARPQLLMTGLSKAFEDYAPMVSVEISGENSRKGVELETLSNFIGMEMDPVRRQALIEKAMKRVGIDVGSLPKLSPEQLAPQGPANPQATPAQV